MTINPPLYGADTPVSFFDEKLPYGWNLRDLGCLLKRPDMPQVPGVTTPMTYFGMWKSFFAWHVVRGSAAGSDTVNLQALLRADVTCGQSLTT